MVISSAVSSVTSQRKALNPFPIQESNRLIRALADSIEEIWSSHLNLKPYPLPQDLGYVEGSLQGECIVIENRCYQSLQFRKLHLELARVGDRLQILHCVMFPRLHYNLPIFGADLVGQSHRVSAAIADLSPTTTIATAVSPTQPSDSTMASPRTLPQRYQTTLIQSPPPDFCTPRELPSWGDIFSDFCLFVAPQTDTEDQQFLAYVQHLLTVHCQFATQTEPVKSKRERADIQAGHHNYCEKQRQNDKTRRVLEMSFGKAWADRYMRTMLFDVAA